MREVLNAALFTEEYDEMVVVKDIDFYTLCEHHMLPFFGKCHVAYMPSRKIVGCRRSPASWRCSAGGSRCRSG